MIFPDGTVVKEYGDGTVKKIYPDGSYECGTADTLQ